MRFALSIFVAAFALLFAAPAFAAPRVVVSAPPGAPRPLVLAPHEGGFAADLVVTNTGDAPLVVARVAILGDEADPRAPARITVRFADGPATTATIAPGASKVATVSWMPDRDPRVRQALGHVVVTSNDEASGDVAIGFRGRVPTALPIVEEHLLSWLLLLPLGGAALALALRVAGRDVDARMRAVALAIAAIELALAAWAYARFAPDVGRADGNEGLQLVERAAWVRPLGVEWYVGVDGTSIVALLAGAIVLAACVVASDVERRAGAYYALVLTLASGLVGAAIAQDVVLLALSWQLALGATCALVGVFGESAGRARAAAKLALVALAAGALFVAALVALRAHTGRSLLVDGAVVARTSSLPDMARTLARGTTAPVAAMLVATLIVAAAFPFHTWLADALTEPPAPVAALVASLAALAPHTLLRAGLVVAPEGARWISGALVGFGAATVVWGALGALAQRDLRRFVAYAATSRVGLAFVGLGALTPQGVAGALAFVPMHAVATALALLLVGAFEARIGARATFDDLGRLAPRARALVVVAILALVGAPGLAGSWATLLVIVGAFPSWPIATAVTLVGAALLAGAAARVLRACFARKDAASDLDARDLALLAPLALVVVLLGVWPVPLLAPASAGARDAIARMNPAGPDPLAEVGRAEPVIAAR